MSLLRRAAGVALERRANNQYAPWGDTSPPPPGFGGALVGGVTVNQAAVFGITAVYGAVGILTDAVSSLPIRVIDSPNDSLATAKELAPSPLILRPYEEISRIDWMVQFVASLALRGNFFGHIISRDQNRFATQIKPIPPDNVAVRRLQNGLLEYRFFNRVIPIDDVYHVKHISMPGMLVGINPIEAMRVTLGLALAQDRWGESFFRNSSNPSGVIQVPGPLNPDETAALSNAWQAAHQGINQANRVAILTDDAEFKPIMLTLEDTQFIASRQFSASQVASLFRIPPHMLSQVDRTTSWGTGIEQQERGFVQNTLQGYLSRAEESLTALHPDGQFVNFDIAHRVQGDSMQQAQIGSLMMLAGAWCADDVRARFNMPPLPNGEGKNVFAPINTELLEEALAQVQITQHEADNPPEPDAPAQLPAGPQPPKRKPSVRAQREMELRRELVDLRRMLYAQQQPNVTTVNLQPSNVDVRSPDVRVSQPAINVHPPQVTVQPPNVEVHPAEVRVEPQINVEAAKTPDVRVEAPNVEVHPPTVNVSAPNVTVEQPKRTAKVVRDKQGRISGIDQE